MECFNENRITPGKYGLEKFRRGNIWQHIINLS